MANDQIPTIDAATLETVTGGTTSSDAQLTTMLQGLSSSIKDVASNQNNGSSISQMLPLMMLARGSGGSAAAPAAASGACPCGCGMANCAPG